VCFSSFHAAIRDPKASNRRCKNGFCMHVEFSAEARRASCSLSLSLCVCLRFSHAAQGVSFNEDSARSRVAMPSRNENEYAPICRSLVALRLLSRVVSPRLARRAGVFLPAVVKHRGNGRRFGFTVDAMNANCANSHAARAHFE
jgi:hypothetical protein